MKQFLVIIICLLASGTISATTIDPDSVFVVTQDDIEQETRQVNSTIQGHWHYGGPSVEVKGKNLLAGAGKAIAKSKVKKKLNKAYKKLGLHKAGPEVTLNQDGTCQLVLLGRSMNGKYNYNPDTEKITFKWLGVPLSANLRRDGSKKLHLTFDADKLLWLLRVAGGITNSSTLKAVKLLTDNYEDVMMGFELKK